MEPAPGAGLYEALLTARLAGLLERLTDERAFWCLGTARYVSHEGDRPIAFVWKLDQPLPADLFTSFAAAVA